MLEGRFCGRGKDANLFHKGQIIGTHQAKKTSKEFPETMKTGLKLSNMLMETQRNAIRQRKILNFKEG